jgi:hypothetical protein
MRLRHATTRANAEKIRAEGLRVACADATARIQAVWLHTASQSAWGTLHTIRKHHAQLDDVVILEVQVPRSALTRFRTGLWYCKTDIPAAWLTGQEWSGTAFGASVSE